MQQEQYTQFALHFKNFGVPQLKAILQSFNPSYRVSYRIHRKELLDILLMVATPADLCATYPTPSDVIIPSKESRSTFGPVESSKSGPGLAYFSYMRELQRGRDDVSDFGYLVPGKKKKDSEPLSSRLELNSATEE